MLIDWSSHCKVLAAVLFGITICCCSASIGGESSAEALKQSQRELDQVTHTAQAMARLNAVITAEPKNALAYALRAWAHEQSGKYDAGLADANRAIALDSGLSQGYRARARIMSARLTFANDGRTEGGARLKMETGMLADFEKAISLKPTDPQAYVDYAFYLECRERYAEALERLHKALDVCPTNVLAHERLAMLFFKLDRPSEAAEEYAQASKLNSANREWYEGQIEHCRTAGAQKSELAQADQALLQAKNASNYMRRAKAYYQLNQHNSDGIKKAKGIADCTEAIKLDPNLSEAYAIRAYLHRIMPDQNDKAAEADYLRAVVLDGDNIDLLTSTGWFYFGSNHMPEAIAFYTRAFHLKPSANILTMRARAYLFSSQYQQCIDDATEAIKMDDRSSAYLERASAYLALKKYDLAKPDLRKCKELGIRDSCGELPDPETLGKDDRSMLRRQNWFSTTVRTVLTTLRVSVDS